MASTHELSQDAYDRLSAELEDLRTRGRIDIADKIERAREHGDLRENGDYHAAKDEQARMEARIAKLNALVTDAVIVEGVASHEVRTGSIVSIRFVGDPDIERYLVGSIEERRDDVEVVSPSAPLGAALLGCRSGDTTSYAAPNGATIEVEVLEVE